MLCCRMLGMCGCLVSVNQVIELRFSFLSCLNLNSLPVNVKVTFNRSSFMSQ